MRTASFSCGAAAALLALLASPVSGQRIQFPSAIPTNIAPARTSGASYGSSSGSQGSYGYQSEDGYGYGNEDSYGYEDEDSYGYGSGDSYNYGSGNSSGYGSQGSSGYGTGGSSGYGTQGSSGYGTRGSSGYGTGSSSGYGSQGSSGYGTGGSSGYGTGGSSGYGTQGSSGYGTRGSSGYGTGSSSGYGSQGSSGYGTGGSSGYGSQGSSGYGTGGSSGYGSQGSSGYGSGGSSGYGSQGSSGYGTQGSSGSGTWGSSGYGRQGSSGYGTGGTSGYGSQGSSAYGTRGSSGYGTGGPSGYGSQGSSGDGRWGSSGYGSQGTSGYGTEPALGYGTGTTPGFETQTTPGYGPGVAPGPTATFQGNIQAQPGWDPWATPGAPPATIFPQDPSVPLFPGYPSDTITTMKRFLQEIRLDYVWMPGTASKEFGINDVDLSATFAIPFLHNPQTPLLQAPLLVTPGFAVHYWNGPPGFSVDIPPRVYDAYLNAAWNPKLSPAFNGELGFRTGVYSDFNRLTRHSLRYQGYGLGVLALSPRFKVKAGIVYLDRQNVKLLPAGGIVWTPSEDVRFEILFPNPKLAVRLPAYSSCEWWGYVRGEYGGGSWTIEDIGPMDYNDIRLAVGVEFATVRRLHGLFETGIAFERELYAHKGMQFDINSTVFLRAGLAY